VIRATVLAASAIVLGGCSLVAHVQVFPLFGKDEQIEPGAVMYIEPSPDTRLSLSVTHTDTSTGIKLGARTKF